MATGGSSPADRVTSLTQPFVYCIGRRGSRSDPCPFQTSPFHARQCPVVTASTPAMTPAVLLHGMGASLSTDDVPTAWVPPHPLAFHAPLGAPPARPPPAALPASACPRGVPGVGRRHHVVGRRPTLRRPFCLPLTAGRSATPPTAGLPYAGSTSAAAAAAIAERVRRLVVARDAAVAANSADGGAEGEGRVCPPVMVGIAGVPGSGKSALRPLLAGLVLEGQLWSQCAFWLSCVPRGVDCAVRLSSVPPPLPRLLLDRLLTATCVVCRS